MTGKKRSSLLSLAIIAVLIFGALSPTVVHADDGTPPSPPTEASSACTTNGDCPSSDGVAQVKGDDPEAASTATAEPTSAPTEVAPEATAAPTEAPTQVGSQGISTVGDTTTPAATEATPAPVDTTATTAPTDTAPAVDTSILTQVPENTTVTVLDAQGQTQPLASQDTANAIATTSDPIWCPAGQPPTPGANGCTSSFSSFDALLTFLSGNASYSGAGTIYVQQGNYTGPETSIDFNSSSYNLSNISNFDLTITGGWNTSNNTVDPTTTSNFNVPILIGTSSNPWGGSLFFGNLTIDHTDGTGLTVYSQNDVNLDNVTITNSVNGGGAEVHAGGNVAINNSRFDRNKTAGATIRANGGVLIGNSSFSNPVGGRRQNTGLDIVNGGPVTLFNVTANNNRVAGATINSNGLVTVVNSFFNGTKSTKGSGANTTFFGYGLQVVTTDSIVLSGVTASDNFLWGASLQATGDVTVADSVFNANTTASPGFIDDTGLLITSGGSVALSNVTASNNRLIGATINAGGDVAIQNSNFSNNNGVILSSTGTPTFYGYGLQVVTPGSIAIDGVTASNNTLFGAHLESGGSTTVSNSTFSNQTSGSATDQTGRGLEVISTGDITLSNVVLDGNQTFGANLQSSGNINLTAVTATNNGADGVDATGNCTTVTVTDGTYSNNGGYGLSVLNAQLTQVGAPVFAGNGIGDIFQDPGSCTFPAGGTTAGAGNGSNAGPGTTTQAPPQAVSPSNTVQGFLPQGTSLVSGKQSSLTVPSSGAKGVTLSSLFANPKVVNGTHFSIFIGDYVYIYSSSGLQIIAFSPSTVELAMGGR